MSSDYFLTIVRSLGTNNDICEQTLAFVPDQ